MLVISILVISAILYYVVISLKRSRYLYRSTLLEPKLWFELMSHETEKNKELIAEAALLQMGDILVKMNVIPSIRLLQNSILKQNISFSNYLQNISKTNVPQKYAENGFRDFDHLVATNQIRTVFAVIVMSLILESDNIEDVFANFEKGAHFPVKDW